VLIVSAFPSPGVAFGGDPGAIRKVLATAARSNACFTRVGATGHVDLDLDVARSSQLKFVRVVYDTTANASVHGCIIHMVKSLQFPTGSQPVRLGWRFRG
jgi:hypothetical protein